MGKAVFGAPEFRARSGRTVKSRSDGSVLFDHVNGYLSPASVMDAEEFFQAKRDAELGRWRWPENPSMIVYPRAYGSVSVLSESIGVSELFDRDSAVDAVFGIGQGAEAARAYFDAHPEPKPWQDAKPGETWRLTVTDRNPDDLDLTFNVIGVENVIGARFARPQVSGEQMEYPIDSPAIVAGRRIWPEDAS